MFTATDRGNKPKKRKKRKREKNKKGNFILFHSK
jgi:hypothetical protein